MFLSKEVTFSGKRSCVTYHLECNHCHSRFTKSRSQLRKNRTNNDVAHFCPSCGPSVVGKYARKAHNPKANIGNKMVTSQGYVEVCVGHDTSYSGVKGGYIREHIKNMQDHLGRKLEKGEVVHHIDGNKSNNLISNLDLCSVSQHNNAHAKAEQIVFELFKQGKVGYDRVEKRYYLIDIT